MRRFRSALWIIWLTRAPVTAQELHTITVTGPAGPVAGAIIELRRRVRRR